ncbi:hypothetical protein [Mycolicibacterium goodii]|uniref:hypothetical protein n=1 Tax=Mycolicibacterium goodii TaxID=134601 RepID=UPI001BDBC4C8|nr:hypothetical protein [Mycolicibacterium goodii]MBU8841234.1 hypothetical protein [Mycolicibacterium goodii]
MAASITTDHGTYTGRTVASIIRREFGRKAYVQWSPDPSRPTAGVILQRLSEVELLELARLHSYEGVLDDE